MHFERGGEQMLALWTIGFPEERILTLSVAPAKARLVEMMGNAVELKRDGERLLVPIEDGVSFLTMSGVKKEDIALAVAQAGEKSVPGQKAEDLFGTSHPGEMWLAGWKPDPSGPFPTDKDGFIRDWLVMGPFANAGRRPNLAGFYHDFLKPIGGESNVTLLEGMSVVYEFPKNRPEWSKTPPRGDVKARAYHSKEPLINFQTCMPFSGNLVTYAYCNVTAPKAMEATMAVGSDDGIQVWLNGHRVFNVRDFRGAKPDADKTQVRLKAGANRLMVKVDDDIGGWGFYLRFLGQNGKPMKSLTVGW
jgi:hypothetical protein